MERVLKSHGPCVSVELFKLQIGLETTKLRVYFSWGGVVFADCASAGAKAGVRDLSSLSTRLMASRLMASAGYSASNRFQGVSRRILRERERVVSRRCVSRDGEDDLSRKSSNGICDGGCFEQKGSHSIFEAKYWKPL